MLFGITLEGGIMPMTAVSTNINNNTYAFI